MSITQHTPPRGTPASRGKLTRLGRNARTWTVDGFTVVEFLDEIDIGTVPEVQTHIDLATRRPGSRVILDLRPALFFDCSALAVMCRARRRVLERGGYLGVVCDDPQHLRIIRATGLTEALNPVPTMELARAGYFAR